MVAFVVQSSIFLANAKVRCQIAFAFRFSFEVWLRCWFAGASSALAGSLPCGGC